MKKSRDDQLCCLIGRAGSQGPSRTSWAPRERRGKWRRWSAWVTWCSWITGGHVLCNKQLNTTQILHLQHECVIVGKWCVFYCWKFSTLSSTSGPVGIQGRTRVQRRKRWWGEEWNSTAAFVRKISQSIYILDLLLVKLEPRKHGYILCMVSFTYQ